MENSLSNRVNYLYIQGVSPIFVKKKSLIPFLINNYNLRKNVIKLEQNQLIHYS